jgi:hypothetical protein
LSRIKIVNDHTNTSQKQTKSSLQSTKNNKEKKKTKRRQKKADGAHNKEWRQTEKGEKE